MLVADLPLPEDAWVSFIIRGGRLEPAHGGTQIQVGDEVVLLAEDADEASLRAVFR